MKTLKNQFFDCGKLETCPSPPKIEIYASLTYRYHVLKAQNDPLFTGPPYPPPEVKKYIEVFSGGCPDRVVFEAFFRPSTLKTENLFKKI